MQSDELIALEIQNQFIREAEKERLNQQLRDQVYVVFITSSKRLKTIKRVYNEGTSEITSRKRDLTR